MRDIDDKIIYALNTSLPTESFKGQVNCEKTCHDLYERLQNGHEQRGNLIKQCIAVSVENLKHLKNERNENPDSIEMAAKFKSEQRKVNSKHLHNKYGVIQFDIGCVCFHVF